MRRGLVSVQRGIIQTVPFALLVAVSAGAAQERLPPPIVGELPSAPEEEYLYDPAGISVTPYVTDLEVIWSLDFAPDGRLFIGERAGRIRVASPHGELEPEPWLTVPTEVRLEDGLLGVTLHPDFEQQPWVYAYYTFRKGDNLVNRVSRFREVNGRGADEEVLIDDIPSGRIHNGGRIKFGPDGMLYISTGDVGTPMTSQDLDNLGGKVLRITDEGEIPVDNPWPGSPVWAYGFRSSHGLAFRPSDGALFGADNGPSTEWIDPPLRHRDELNLIRRGENYGWPLAVGAPGLEEYADPVLSWIPALPPGGLTFYSGDLLPELEGDLFYSSLRGEALLRIRFDDPGDAIRVTGIERWFHNGEDQGSRFGRLRGLTVGPDGALYVGTGNQDRRSPLREGDDRVLRIAPAAN